MSNYQLSDFVSTLMRIGGLQGLPLVLPASFSLHLECRVKRAERARKREAEGLIEMTETVWE